MTRTFWGCERTTADASTTDAAPSDIKFSAYEGGLPHTCAISRTVKLIIGDVDEDVGSITCINAHAVSFAVARRCSHTSCTSSSLPHALHVNLRLNLLHIFSAMHTISPSQLELLHPPRSNPRSYKLSPRQPLMGLPDELWCVACRLGSYSSRENIFTLFRSNTFHHKLDVRLLCIS